MIPEGQKIHTDLIDILIEASQEIEEVSQPDGTTQKQLLLNPEIIWWKTGIINSPTFGRFAYMLKEWERQAEECFDNMCRDRAFEIAKDIIEIGKSFRRSIDAKSSESLRDKNNTQSTLIDKINRNKIEKLYTVKGEGKKSLMAGLLGAEGERDKDNED